MIKAAIFDMDGVIIDSHFVAFQLLTNSANKLGCNITIDEIKSWGSLSSKKFWQKIKEIYNINEPLESLINQYNVDEEIELYKKMSPINGVIDFVKLLKNNDIKLGLATSATEYRMQAVIKLFNLNKYFNVFTCDNEVINSKPDPEIFIKTAEKLKVKPANCLVIEDSENGKIAAKKAKMKVIGFKGLNHIDENMDGSDLIIYNFNDIKMDDIIDL